jgi:hypothetical protein
MMGVSDADPLGSATVLVSKSKIKQAKDNFKATEIASVYWAFSS